ncbi:hypothetical protein ACJIZ3_008033 [Penstemon smallii]|uniref:Uncharacterized protein n=1 Tax=Penstemon smallii TaxID=265156 RepID=A0ABD3T8M1_9LAMI
MTCENEHFITCSILSIETQSNTRIFMIFKQDKYSLTLRSIYFNHLLPYSSPPSIDPQLTANSPKEQQTTAKTANQATKFAKSTRPEHVLGGPKQQIAKLN